MSWLIDHDPFRGAQKKLFKASEAGSAVFLHVMWFILLLLFLSYWAYHQGKTLYNLPHSSVITYQPIQVVPMIEDHINVIALRLSPQLAIFGQNITQANQLYSISLGYNGLLVNNSGTILANGISFGSSYGNLEISNNGKFCLPSGCLYASSCRKAIDPFLAEVKHSYSRSTTPNKFVFAQDIPEFTRNNYWLFNKIQLQFDKTYIIPICNYGSIKLYQTMLNSNSLTDLRPYIQAPMATIDVIRDSSGVIRPLFQWLYAERTQTELIFQSTVTYSKDDNFFALNPSDLPIHDLQLQYIYPQPQPVINDYSALVFGRLDQYQLVERTKANWFIAWLSAVGGIWTTLIFVVGIAVSINQRCLRAWCVPINECGAKYVGKRIPKYLQSTEQESQTELCSYNNGVMTI